MKTTLFLTILLRNLLLTGGILIVCFFIAVTGHAEPKEKEKRILFLGSSSTYCHDLPLRVSEWLNAHAGWKTKVCLTGKSGTGFHEYLHPGFQSQYGLKEGQSLLEKIRDEKYDYVVIQQITYFMGGEEQIDHETARYLQKTAWEVWKEINKKLK
jgi:hypothetical protein